MKIRKLLLLSQVLMVCLTLTIVSLAQVGSTGSDKQVSGPKYKKVLGTVSSGKRRVKVQLLLETNGVLSIGNRRVDELGLQDCNAYIPGKSSDQKKVVVKNGKILVDGLLVVRLRLADVTEAPRWTEECNCWEPPIPPGPPPPIAPELQPKVTPAIKQKED